MKPVKIFLIFLVYRIMSIFLVQTMYVPDEYWQSLEVAHKIAFGYGHLTWEWTHGIRSFFYPGCITILYKLLEILNLDYVFSLVTVPRLAQALLSSLGDFFFWKWYSNETRTSGLWAAYSFATSWFWFYCASRTLTNTIETVLTIFGLYCFPWHSFRKEKEVNHKFFHLSGESDDIIIVTPISSRLLYC
ncbi:unnamed protein product [Timema podura]|uniref:Mannosyltransferase n=1 Tax=Timema podura TaxID=61482 RepID=A0ABN7NP80_TIMPD|nr:unnamed protein product [Timema podura]